MVNLEKYFKALASQKRIDLFTYLQKNGECTIEQLVDKFKLSYKTVFRNLSILREAGFVESRIYKSRALFKVNKRANDERKYLAILINKNKNILLERIGCE